MLFLKNTVINTKKEDRFQSLINRLIDLETDNINQDGAPSEFQEIEFDVSDALKMRDALSGKANQQFDLSSHITLGKFNSEMKFSLDDPELDLKLFQFAKSLLFTADGKFNSLIPITVGDFTEEQNDFIVRKLKNILFEYSFSEELTEKLIEKVKPEIASVGPLQAIYNNPNVDAVLINAYDQIYVEQNGKLVLINSSFLNKEHFYFTIQKLVNALKNKPLDQNNMIIEGILEDNSKIYILNENSNKSEPRVIIRKDKEKSFSIKDLCQLGMLNEKMALFLEVCLKNKVPLWVIGPTRSGKTTLLNALINLLPKDERIVTVEKSAELKVQKDRHWIPIHLDRVEEINLSKILSSVYKLRADSLIFNDLDKNELNEAIEIINNGEEGILVSVLVRNSKMLLNYIEYSFKADFNSPFAQLLKENILLAVPVIIECGIDANHKPRIRCIKELIGIKDNQFQFEDIFLFDDKNSRLPSFIGSKRIPLITKTFVEQTQNLVKEIF
ncbi:MAG: ATPase, T2SS/T4P/T4SS family [Candidatus Margulisiibacteriota bacterium]|jgi:pilus assembly protein CpaF